jgi:enoyl-CoA hydratase/carnithine racemase
MTVKITNHSVEGFGWQQWHIARPERLNAIGTGLAGELSDTLDLIRKNPPAGIRAIVITAETVTKGDKSIWIAGGDLKELAMLKTKPEGRAYAKTMREFCEGLEYLTMPVVTVIDGAAIGGGAELALAGDVRFATVRSSLEFKQLKMGLATGYGAASRLVELLGKSRAQSLLYFSESLDAEEAHQQGLVHRLIPSASADDIGGAILPILRLEPAAVSAQKKLLRHTTTLSPGDHTWADDVFESIWLNETHVRNLEEFSRR